MGRWYGTAHAQQTKAVLNGLLVHRAEDAHESTIVEAVGHLAELQEEPGHQYGVANPMLREDEAESARPNHGLVHAWCGRAEDGIKSVEAGKAHIHCFFCIFQECPLLFVLSFLVFRRVVHDGVGASILKLLPLGAHR